MNNKNKAKVIESYLQFLKGFESFQNALKEYQSKDNKKGIRTIVKLTKILGACEIMLSILNKLGELVSEFCGDCIIDDKK